MKFKSIFILFNAVVGISLFFVFAMPFFALGSQYATSFWALNWPLALILIGVLIALDLFFALNWTLFALLEREDWPALSVYLERRVVGKKHWSPRLTRLLANTYLVLADAPAVVGLEKKVADARPALLDRNALVFGVARVLLGDAKASVAFFSDRIGKKNLENNDWVGWYLAFSLLLAKDFSRAADTLIPLAAKSRDALVTALAWHFLGETLIHALPDRSVEIRSATETARARVLSKLPTKETWDKEIIRANADIHVVVLSKSLDEASARLYSQV